MKIKLTKPSTISGVNFPVGFEMEIGQVAGEWLVSVDGAEDITDTATTKKAVVESDTSAKPRRFS